MNNADPIEVMLKALALRGRISGERDGDACPSDEKFGAFMDKALPEEESQAIQSHIAECPDCSLAYQAWLETSDVEGPPVPAPLMASARALVRPSQCRVILELLKKAFRILNPDEVIVIPEPECTLGAARRSGEAHLEDQYEVVDIKASLPHLEMIRIQHFEDTETLKLSLFPSPELPAERMKRIRVDLYSESGLVQSWPLYKEGTSLNPIEKGAYRLSLVEIEPSTERHKVRSLGFMELDLQGD